MPEKINSEILRNYSLFKRVKNTLKTVLSENIILHQNSNHKVGKEKTEPVIHSEINDINLTIKADKVIGSRYQFHLRSATICKEPFFRFDASGLTHRNRNPNTPLSKQQITTPHFQYYDDLGINTAYKTEELNNNEIVNKIQRNINYGMAIFCQESVTFTENRKVPFIVLNDGLLFETENIDPLININFD